MANWKWINENNLSHQEWIQEAQFPPITKQQPLIIAAGDIQYPEIVLHYTNSQTNRHMPPQDIVASCACGEGEGGTKQIWLFQQIMGRGTKHISVVTELGGGGTKHISVLLQNWGVRNILGLGQNRGYETFWRVIFRGTKHVNISWKGVRNISGRPEKIHPTGYAV